MRSRPALAGTPFVLALSAVVALVAAACGPGASRTPSPAPTSSAANLTLFPVMITKLAVGDNRVLFSYLDQANQPAAAPDRTAKVDFIPKDASAPVASTTGRFVWGIEGKAGIYVGHAKLPSSGPYTARFTTRSAAGATETADLAVDVLRDDPSIGVGDPAPPSVTKTLADVGGDVAQISTDKDPEPRLYESSIKDAVESNKPFVVVFATPAFCQTQQCGPTLDRVKAVAAKYPDLTVINVEPYELEMTDGSLQPVLTNNNLTPVQAVVDWDLQSEPWVYVVDAAGIVRSSLGLIFLDDELTDAIDEVTASS
jgi:hypothetical protein